MLATIAYLGLFATLTTAWLEGWSDVDGVAVSLSGGAALLVVLT